MISRDFEPSPRYNSDGNRLQTTANVTVYVTHFRQTAGTSSRCLPIHLFVFMPCPGACSATICPTTSALNQSYQIQRLTVTLVLADSSRQQLFFWTRQAQPHLFRSVSRRTVRRASDSPDCGFALASLARFLEFFFSNNVRTQLVMVKQSPLNYQKNVRTIIAWETNEHPGGRQRARKHRTHGFTCARSTLRRI